MLRHFRLIPIVAALVALGAASVASARPARIEPSGRVHAATANRAPAARSTRIAGVRSPAQSSGSDVDGALIGVSAAGLLLMVAGTATVGRAGIRRHASSTTA